MHNRNTTVDKTTVTEKNITQKARKWRIGTTCISNAGLMPHKHKRQTQTGRAQAAVICVCGWRVLRGIWLSVVPSRCHERR